ncbi:MAG: methyltransferase domain-containing protein [Pseudomonadota bacterium]
MDDPSVELSDPRHRLLEVTALDTDGLGIATANGVAYRVKGALPGERVEARVVRKRRRIRYTEAQAVLGDPAEARVTHRCDAFPRCGGCALQHVGDAEALRIKERQLLLALADAEVEPRQLAPAVTGPRLHYRRKARLGVKRLGEQTLVGFRESFSARVGRMASCPILVEPFASSLRSYADLIAGLSAPDRVPQLEVAAGDRAQQLILRHLDPLTADDLARLRAFERAHGQQFLVQPHGPDSVRTLDGALPPLLSYALMDFGLSLEFAATEFTQVNAWINARLVADVATLLAQVPRGAVLDLFCGIGNFSLALAQRGFSVFGAEAAAGSIERARSNARRNGLAPQCEFQVVDLYDSAASSLPAAPLWVLDPPRSGAGPQLERWLAEAGGRGPEVIVYVSCNPATFATDARRLVAQGFGLERVGIYDMFPYTSHIETLGLFTR